MTCVEPYGPAAAIPECAATEVCVSSGGDQKLDATNCSEPSCRFTFQENVGPTLTYDDKKTFVFLRFRDSIAGATTESLAAVFEHVNFYVSYPVEGAKDDAIYFEQRSGMGAFEIFELVEGRLHVKLAFTVDSPYLWIHSSDPACVSGDVLGMCVCNYGPTDWPASVEIDLPADIPAP